MNDSQKQCVRLADSFLQAVAAKHSAEKSFEAKIWAEATVSEQVRLLQFRQQYKNLPTGPDDLAYALNRLGTAEIFAGIFNRVCTPEEKQSLVPAGANQAAVIATLEKAKATQLVKLFSA